MNYITGKEIVQIPAGQKKVSLGEISLGHSSEHRLWSTRGEIMFGVCKGVLGYGGELIESLRTAEITFY